MEMHRCVYLSVQMDSEMRRNIIIEFVVNHQGCTAEIIVDGVKDQMSRTLVFSTLKGLLQDHILEDNKVNRRNHRYFVNRNNLLYSVTQELNEFEEKSVRWVGSMKDKYTSAIVLAKKTNLHADYRKAEDIGIFAWLTLKTMVTDLVYTYTAVALSKWPKQSKDREFLEKLYATVFSKFHRIISRLSKIIIFFEDVSPETAEAIRQMPRSAARDIEAFRYSWEGLRDRHLDSTEFDDLMNMVWKIGLDDDEQPNWKDVLENPDEF
jgi:hypothetical protein